MSWSFILSHSCLGLQVSPFTTQQVVLWFASLSATLSGLIGQQVFKCLYMDQWQTDVLSFVCSLTCMWLTIHCSFFPFKKRESTKQRGWKFQANLQSYDIHGTSSPIFHILFPQKILQRGKMFSQTEQRKMIFYKRTQWFRTWLRCIHIYLYKEINVFFLNIS